MKMLESSEQGSSGWWQEIEIGKRSSLIYYWLHNSSLSLHLLKELLLPIFILFYFFKLNQHASLQSNIMCISLDFSLLVPCSTLAYLG